jgi:hypothetical protein
MGRFEAGSLVGLMLIAAAIAVAAPAGVSPADTA